MADSAAVGGIEPRSAASMELKELARRCVADPSLERFFRDEEPDDPHGPARWTPAHLERYARVLAADGTLERRRTVTGIARTDRRSHSPREAEEDSDSEEDDEVLEQSFQAKMRVVGKTGRRLVLTRASLDSSKALAGAVQGAGDLPDKKAAAEAKGPLAPVLE